MTFEKLGDNVVLVELTDTEMNGYSVTYETLSSDDPHAKIMIKKIVERSKELSFSKRNCEKITVEAFPICDGGCFFILTFTPKKSSRYLVKNQAENIIIEYENMDSLLDFSLALKSSHSQSDNGKLYRYNEKYFLFTDKFSSHLPEEYGKVHNGNSVFANRITEYGTFLGNFPLI